MNDTDIKPHRTSHPAMVWSGRILSVILAALFAMSGIMKLRGGPELDEGMAHLGLPASMVIPLAIVELTCVVVYLIPMTSVLGAILLTGYIGGAICTHWRVGDPFFLHIGIGMAVWLGIFLRNRRLRTLIPFVRD